MAVCCIRLNSIRSLDFGRVNGPLGEKEGGNKFSPNAIILNLDASSVMEQGLARVEGSVLVIPASRDTNLQALLTDTNKPTRQFNLQLIGNSSNIGSLIVITATLRPMAMLNSSSISSMSNGDP